MDYVEAHNAFVRWDQEPEKEEGSLVRLQELMKKRPELRPRYDHQIGQNLLMLTDIDKASLYITQALERTKRPYYSDYAKTSLKISNGEYAEALTEARRLKETLLTDGEETHSVLFAFNLMRIATLCQELEDTAGELTTWKEIKRYGGWEREEDASADEAAAVTQPRGFKQLLHHFTLQEVTLADYIREREEQIGK